MNELTFNFSTGVGLARLSLFRHRVVSVRILAVESDRSIPIRPAIPDMWVMYTRMRASTQRAIRVHAVEHGEESVPRTPFFIRANIPRHTQRAVQRSNSFTSRRRCFRLTSTLIDGSCKRVAVQPRQDRYRCIQLDDDQVDNVSLLRFNVRFEHVCLFRRLYIRNGQRQHYKGKVVAHAIEPDRIRCERPIRLRRSKRIYTCHVVGYSTTRGQIYSKTKGNELRNVVS